MAKGRFTLTYGGRDHVVTVADAGSKKVYSWLVNDVEVASQETMDNEVVLETGSDHATYPNAKLIVKGGWFAVHRATLVADGNEIDLVPDPGTAAARREARIREHPTRHTVIAAAVAIAKVVLPLLIGMLVYRLALPAIPWPDWSLPAIPWPTINLPSIPWPSIDLPSLPRLNWEPPGWLRWILENGNYIIPVLVALGLARNEVRRRTKQDQRRRAAQPAAQSQRDAKSQPAGDPHAVSPTSSQDDQKQSPT